MNSKVTLIALAALILIGLGAYMLSKNNSDDAASTSPTVSPSAEAEHNDADGHHDTSTTPSPSSSPSSGTSVSGGASVGVSTGTVKEFTVNAANFTFAPATMNVKKGDTVKITLDNTEGFHDLVIDEYKVATKKLQAGQKETITFVADKTGSFEYYCSVGTHRQMGMKGTLVVQ